MDTPECLQRIGITIIDVIGRGGFSTVYKCEQKTKDGKELVVDKTVDKNNMALAMNEYTVLKSLNHDNIVHIINTATDAREFHLIMEYCQGSLSMYIVKRHKLAESVTKYFMRQLALAVKYLHELNICHMDIKTANILLSWKSNHSKLVLKLADFGLSGPLKGDYENTRNYGTIQYMAPEKIRNEKFDSRIDLWSVGMVTFECLFGRTFFHNCTVQKMKEHLKNKLPITLPAIPTISTTCEDFLKSLLRYDPASRLQFTAYFAHGFLDLERMPTRENYLLCEQLAQHARRLVIEQKPAAEILPVYRRVVHILEGFLEVDRIKDHTEIAFKLHEYTEFIKKLEADQASTKTISATPNAVQQTQQQQRRSNVSEMTVQFRLLCDMCCSTPILRTGLEIGSIGEQYAEEGHHLLAYSNLMNALHIIVEAVKLEPAGQRKQLLLAQISKWITLSESFKDVDTLR